MQVLNDWYSVTTLLEHLVFEQLDYIYVYTHICVYIFYSLLLKQKLVKYEAYSGSSRNALGIIVNNWGVNQNDQVYYEPLVDNRKCEWIIDLLNCSHHITYAVVNTF